MNKYTNTYLQAVAKHLTGKSNKPTKLSEIIRKREAVGQEEATGARQGRLAEFIQAMLQSARAKKAGR